MCIRDSCVWGFYGADTSNHPGDPKGTDTVPAWLTPGENVVNAEASRLPGNQEKIDKMNEEGRKIQRVQVALFLPMQLMAGLFMLQKVMVVKTMSLMMYLNGLLHKY